MKIIMSITGYPEIKMKGKLADGKFEVVDHETGGKKWINNIKNNKINNNSDKIIITGGFKFTEHLYKEEDFKV